MTPLLFNFSSFSILTCREFMRLLLAFFNFLSSARFLEALKLTSTPSSIKLLSKNIEHLEFPYICIFSYVVFCLGKSHRQEFLLLSKNHGVILTHQMASIWLFSLFLMTKKCSFGSHSAWLMLAPKALERWKSNTITICNHSASRHLSVIPKEDRIIHSIKQYNTPCLPNNQE